MSISAGEPLLSVSDLDAGYGKVPVLRGISLEVMPGEVVSILGPNGAGKTTLLNAISGLLPIGNGRVRFDGRDLAGEGPRAGVVAGLIHVIEGHRIFTQISIEDNLRVAGYAAPRGERQDRVEAALRHFPELVEKRADLGGSLSGGQQQMLAVAQGLVLKPKLLMLDEPSAGLSPVLVDRVLSVIATLRSEGTAIILVEQLIEKALSVSDRVLALSQGRIVLDAPAAEDGLSRRLEETYFGQSVS